MPIVGLMVIVAACLVAIGSQLSAMANMPAAIMVVGMTLGMLLFGGSSIGSMLGTLFRTDANPQAVREAASDWRVAAAYAISAGAIGTLVGLIIMLKNMDDPARVLPGLAISLLTSLYGFTLAIAICLPLGALLEGRLGREGTPA